MRIISLSDWSHRAYDGSVPQTGFGRMHRLLLEHLHARGHEVIEVGVGYQGQFLAHPPPWPVVSPSAYGRIEGQDMLPLLANQVDADIVLILADVPDIAYLAVPELYRDRRTGQPLREDVIAHIDVGSWKRAAYTVIDGACPNGHIPKEWLRVFRGFDGVAVASRWGCDVVERETGVRPAYIPHAVDTDLFVPQDKLAARARFGIDPEAFVILSVGVNRRRKMIPAWFETVANFTARTEAKNVLYWIHSYKVPDSPGYDLQALAEHYELKRLGVTSILTEGVPDAAMPTLYACADVLLNLSNEGFGMAPLEAAAMRVPPLITDYASTDPAPEVEGRFLHVPVKALVPQEGNAICWAWPDTDVAAERLERIYKEPKFRTLLRRKSWEHAQRFSVRNVLPKFERWLTGLVDMETPRPVTADVI